MLLNLLVISLMSSCDTLVPTACMLDISRHHKIDNICQLYLVVTGPPFLCGLQGWQCDFPSHIFAHSGHFGTLFANFFTVVYCPSR